MDTDPAPSQKGSEAEPDESPWFPRPPAVEQDKDQVVNAAFRRHLAEKWTKPYACPICGSEEWRQGHSADIHLRYIPEKAYTVIPIQCTNCAYTIFFNGVLAGLFEDGEPVGWVPTPSPSSNDDPQDTP